MIKTHDAIMSGQDYNLRGRRLRLERVGPQHIDFLVESLRDHAFWYNYRANQPRRLTRDQLLNSLQREAQLSPVKLRKIEWIVKLALKDQLFPVGLACLADFIPASKRAELLIGIQDQHARQFGVAVEATLLVMDFAFNQAKLNKLISYVYEGNKSAQESTLSLGFVQEGRLREHIYKKEDDSFINVIQNGLLLREFRISSKLRRLSLKTIGRDITAVTRAESTISKPGDEAWTINAKIDYT